MSSHERRDEQEGHARPPVPDIMAILGENKPRRRFPWGWLAVVVILVVAGYGGYRFYETGAVQFTAAIPGYTTAEVIRGPMNIAVRATGAIEPTDRVEISSELSGTVKDVLVDFNSEVKAGDVLLELETDELAADILSAKAKLAAANADVASSASNLESAKATMDRTETLAKRNVAPRQDFEDAQFAYAAALADKQSAEARLDVAKAELALAELRLSKATIRSPIDGIVLYRNVDVGQTFTTSLEAPTLFVIAGDLSRMELRVDIDEADVGKVEPGQKASFTVEAFPDKRFPAEIDTIRYASELNSAVVTYKAVLLVDNSERLLRQGMTATADILVSETDDVILVPTAALRFVPAGYDAPTSAGDERTAWLLRNGEPLPVPITVGASDGRYTVVVGGDLRAGDMVITGNGRDAREGR
ncbi:efflux RND transporter periplasmic adaptor subunit [Martelella soudanensis]|uniref:efflux RND transporter periplasmic adaptor subunit n=1 Tax=unclassified Martelella TaxID=2629616 RepID=UPI0015DDA9A7|nr:MULTISPECIES: efflux RND transporter periplasmic adaptor subunit [unclassified Martelella]